MEELIKLIKDLKDDYKLIAPHVRHVIEHYRALIHCHLTTNYEMSYEKKKRDFGLEKEAHYAIHALRGIDNMSKMIDRFRTVQVDGMKSTLGRELGYCQDHQVHHEALIRTILNNNGKEDLIGKDFGVSKSTIAHRNDVAESSLMDIPVHDYTVVDKKTYNEEETDRRMNIIGQNGNEGTHYE